jgi:hypothetical protein
VALGVVILACLALISPYIWPNQGTPAHVTGVYYANEETGELSLQPPQAIAPLTDAAGRPVLVQAHLYSTDGGKTKSVAYYEKFTDRAKAMIEASFQDRSKYDGQLFASGRLVRLPANGSPWVAAESDAGRNIIASFPTGGNVTDCSRILH